MGIRATKGTCLVVGRRSLARVRNAVLEALGTAVGRQIKKLSKRLDWNKVHHLEGMLEAERERQAEFGPWKVVGCTGGLGPRCPDGWARPSWRVSERPGPLNICSTCLTGTGRTHYSRAPAPEPGLPHGKGLSFLSLHPGPSLHPGRWGPGLHSMHRSVLASGVCVD